jgi:hypothetical protein
MLMRRDFIRAQARSLIAVDFFAVETLWLQRVYALFFIELATRRVHLAGCTAHPDGNWVAQQARHIAWTLAERPEPVRVLIRDRDQKFTRSFDAVFQSEGLRVIRTPIRAPQANAFAERFVRTARSECLDWLLILNARHLERVLAEFIEHYNGHRPHRALALTAPQPTRPPLLPAPASGWPLSSAASGSVVWFTSTLSRRERSLCTLHVMEPS